MITWNANNNPPLLHQIQQKRWPWIAMGNMVVKGSQCSLLILACDLVLKGHHRDIYGNVIFMEHRMRWLVQNVLDSASVLLMKEIVLSCISVCCRTNLSLKNLSSLFQHELSTLSLVFPIASEHWCVMCVWAFGFFLLVQLWLWVTNNLFGKLCCEYSWRRFFTK